VKNRLNGLCDLFWEQVLSVKTGFEDGLDTFVRVAFDLEGKGAPIKRHLSREKSIPLEGIYEFPFFFVFE